MIGESSLALVVGQPDVQGLAGTGHLAGLKYQFLYSPPGPRVFIITLGSAASQTTLW